MLESYLSVFKGVVLANAIAFLVLPLITRLYTPEAFGEFQVYQSVMLPLLVITAMRYEIALMNATDEREAVALLNLCFGITLLTAVIVALVCWATLHWAVLPKRLTTESMWLLPPAILFAGITQTLGYLPLREKRFAEGARLKIAQAAGTAVGGVALGISAPVGAGLIAGDIVGKVTALMSFLQRRASFDTHAFSWSGFAEIRAVAAKYHALPLQAVPGGLINAAGSAMTSICIYGYFSASISGQFGLVERCVMLPLGVVSLAISQVFMAELSSSARAGVGELYPLFRRIVWRTLLVGLIPTLACAIVGSELVQWVFGQQWALAGEFVEIMAPLALISFIATPVSMTLMLIDQQRLQLIWEIVRLLLMGGAWAAIFANSLSPKAAIVLHVAASCIAYLFYLLLANWALRRYRL